MKKVLAGIFIVFFLSAGYVTSLGISPAVYEIDFSPGEVFEIDYKVSSDSDNEKIRVFVEGDLDYIVELDKKELNPGEGFKAKLTMPDRIETSGVNRLYIGVESVPKEGGTLGTSIKIKSVVKIFAPYPGKYLEGYLEVPDGNVGDVLPIELFVINRGTERADFTPEVNFFESGNIVGKVKFDSVSLETNQEKKFQDFLNVEGYRPGDYFAEVAIDHGKGFYFNDSFRIGSLYVKVINYTSEVKKGGIERFNVAIESNWNGVLEDVFADVNLSTQDESFFFRTPSVVLNPWETKTLTGFIDTTELEGEYDAEIVLNYDGEKTVVEGKVYIRKTNFVFLVLFISGLFILALVVFIVAYKVKNRKKDRKIRK